MYILLVILLTLRELAKHLRKADAEDAEVYEELARQAIRHQTKVDVTSLCLSVSASLTAYAIPP
jgi:exosome complex RNA-binding protein Rrp42 (RNase PH superfamily)